MPFFFYFSVRCEGETIFFYVGWVFFSIGGGVVSEISGAPPSKVYLNGTALNISWQSVLLVKETVVPAENHRLVVSH